MRQHPPPLQWARASSFTRLLDHTQRRITVGRTRLAKWLSRRRDLYLTTQNTHNRQTYIRALGGIRNHNLSRRAAEDLRLTPRDHCDRRDGSTPLIYKPNICAHCTYNSTISIPNTFFGNYITIITKCNTLSYLNMSKHDVVTILIHICNVMTSPALFISCQRP